MNIFEFVRCSKNDVRVRSMYDKMVFDPSLKKTDEIFFFRYTSPPSAESTTSSSTISQKVDSSANPAASEAPREARPPRFNPTLPDDNSAVGGGGIIETPLVSSPLAASLGNLSKTRYNQKKCYEKYIHVKNNLFYFFLQNSDM